MRTLLFLAALMLISACASAQKVQKMRADYSTFTAERNDRSVEERCADQAMPGTAANLECQLALQKPARQKPDAPAH